jgi:uncharacterized protein (DUF486 family)
MMPVTLQTILLLICSNVFMTFAWYGHLKNLSDKPWYLAALFSWAIAFFEYMLMVPANRIGHTAMSVGQLKIMQEVITLTVFVPFAIFISKSPSKWIMFTQGYVCWEQFILCFVIKNSHSVQKSHFNTWPTVIISPK